MLVDEILMLHVIVDRADPPHQSCLRHSAIPFRKAVMSLLISEVVSTMLLVFISRSAMPV
jgi:hypothetical protein